MALSYHKIPVNPQTVEEVCFPDFFPSPKNGIIDIVIRFICSFIMQEKLDR